MSASYAQTSFLGGEISQWAQGKLDDPHYKISMDKCLNAYPVDEGACPRRPGFGFLGTTRFGKPGRVMPFDFAEATPYNMEFTDGFLRLWNGTQLVTTNDNQTVTSITNTSPAIFGLSAAVSWQTNDLVIMSFANPANAVLGAALLNRQFILTMLSQTTFSIKDSITGVAINGSDLGFISNGSVIENGPISGGSISEAPISATPSSITILSELSPTVAHVAQVVTPYTVAKNDWRTLRAVQGNANSVSLAMLLCGTTAPRSLSVVSTPTPTSFASFAFSAAQFQDGPYLDPPNFAIATPVGQSGVITLTMGYNAWVSTTTYGIGIPVTYGGQDYFSVANNNKNNTPGVGSAFWVALNSGSMISPQGFVSTDVGRMIRLFSSPLNWDPTVTYSAGQSVTYNGSYFTSLVGSNTNNEPDISLTNWVINTSAAIWTWGTITSIVAPNSVTLQLQGANLLYTTAIQSFRIGAWSDTTGWPTCGCFFEGRFWFSGAIPNRLDSSSPNQPFNMAPTGQDGTVADSNAISYTLNATSSNPIFWMEPDTLGIIIGTQEGEWHLTTGSAGNPMTPSSIQAHRVTKYGCANILPVRTGLTICFVQRYARRLFEYLADVFSQRFYAPDLTTRARHLGSRTFEELAYQQELAPIVWGRMGDGSLVGTTYRRVSLISTQDPEFNGWHQHQLGSSRLVESICVGPSNDGSLDALAMVTNDPSTNIRFVESATTLLDETDPLTLANFLDCSVTPQAASLNDGAVTFYGLTYLNGKKVSVFAAAVDCGDYVVENGQVTVPLGTLDAISGYTFDIPQFNLLQPQASTFASVSTMIVGGTQDYIIPCVIGFNYKTQGQLCRPASQNDTGARNGPGYGKKKRQARYAITLVNSMGVKVGTTLGKTKPVPTTTPGGKQLPYLTTATGIKRETLTDDFSFDSMLCWETTRPYPATVVTYGGFIETEDV